MKIILYRTQLGIIATIIVVVGILFGSVTLHERHSSTEALHRADALIDEAPDSAAAIISEVDPYTLPSDASHALYSLLQARLATIYNATPSDSLLDTAIDYYKNRLGERGRYVQALVCRGLKERRLGNVKEATITLRTAHDKVDADDYLNRGITEFCLAQLYEENYGINPSRVADRYMAALADYNRAGSKRFALTAISACARAYRQSNEAVADSCLERAIIMARDLGNKSYYYDNLEYKARILAERGEYGKALDLARLCLTQGKGHTGNDVYYGMALAYAGLGKPDSALIWTRKATSSATDPYDNITRYSTLSHIATIKGDSTLARQWADSCQMETDSLANKPQMRIIKYAEGEYDAASHITARRHTIWLWATLSLVVAVIIIASAITIAHRRRINRDFENFKRKLNKGKRE